MNLKKKKKGFTLIELMAVIAIIAILAAVLVPTVSGYITRSKKTAVITQVRNVISAVETFNATATGTGSKTDGSDNIAIPRTSESAITAVAQNIGTDLLDTKKSIDKLGTMTIKQAYSINEDPSAINKITVSLNGVFSTYTGTLITQ